MVKTLSVLLTILAVFLTACQSASVSPTMLPATEEATAQIGDSATSTELPPLPEVSPTPTTEQTRELDEANCTVVSRQPTPGPTEPSIVPAVSDTDWVHGPEDAKVTIIEYGDFQ
jgi:hypothetical protein